MKSLLERADESPLSGANLKTLLVRSFTGLTQSRTHHAPPFGAGVDYASRSRTLGRTYLGGPAAPSEAPLSSLRGLAAERQVSPCIRARRSASDFVDSART